MIPLWTISPTTLGIAILALFIFRLLWIQQESRKLPPGPRKLPLIENLLDMPTRIEASLFTKMGKEYDSDIIHLGALGQSLVVLNSFKACQDLLDKRSSIYSSRPDSVMLRDLCGWGWALALRPYGDRWRNDRRSYVKYLESKRQMCEEKELFYARSLLPCLLDEPERFLDHILQAVGSVVMSTTYGFKIGPNDPYMHLAEKTVKTLTECMMGGIYLPDIVPWARYLPSWIPGLKFHAIADASRKVSSDFVNKPFDDARERLLSGESLPSIVAAGLDDIANLGEEGNAKLESLKGIAAGIYLGGADTSSAVLSFLVLAMVKYPEVQRRVQEELDTAFQGRLPELQDVKDLPYLNAVVMETYRWKPIGPIAIPHFLIEEDVYEGYYIPKGSTVIPNVEAMMYDERDYPEPHIFRPERFIKDGKINESVRNPMDILFGFGRRQCVGRERAHSTIMIHAAGILSTFSIEKAKDKNGRLIEPVEGFIEGVARLPVPFECSIKPRSQVAVELIRAWAVASDAE